jgi:hypothetical protein
MICGFEETDYAPALLSNQQEFEYHCCGPGKFLASAGLARLRIVIFGKATFLDQVET